MLLNTATSDLSDILLRVDSNIAAGVFVGVDFNRLASVMHQIIVKLLPYKKRIICKHVLNKKTFDA